MAERDENGFVDVTGIILPNDWDPYGTLIEVVLYGADESEYVLSGTHERALSALCHHRVQCAGKPVLDNRGRRLLVVERFAVLGDGLDSGYDLGWDTGGPVGATFPRMWRQ